MFNVFTLGNGRLVQREVTGAADLAAAEPVWVDMEAPSTEEQGWISQRFGLLLPGRRGAVGDCARGRLERPHPPPRDGHAPRAQFRDAQLWQAGYPFALALALALALMAASVAAPFLYFRRKGWLR
jgi:Mg2+ and Co2+ transporter CorA